MTIDEYVDRGLDLMLNPVVTVRGKRGYARMVEAQKDKSLNRNAVGA